MCGRHGKKCNNAVVSSVEHLFVVTASEFNIEQGPTCSWQCKLSTTNARSAGELRPRDSAAVLRPLLNPHKTYAPPSSSLMLEAYDRVKEVVESRILFERKKVYLSERGGLM
ncbi:hypothetical protein EVAR_37260_1 [Eumeta japonica]|uniref:Uncharacterized protein n=1 Tax=Eumeta variegata TaxID=151549 RepID=A0A4C1WMS6_EUMVA|nr:hypothetical protein EVAR_37260_1 [Eumeta japonica]